MILEERVNEKTGSENEGQEDQRGVSTPARQSGTVQGGDQNSKACQSGDQSRPGAEGVKSAPAPIKLMGPGMSRPGMMEEGQNPDVQVGGQKWKCGRRCQKDNPQQIRKPQRPVR